VLTSENAGRGRPEAALLFAVHHGGGAQPIPAVATATAPQDIRGLRGK
jgi:hypothetical protein